MRRSCWRNSLRRTRPTRRSATIWDPMAVQICMAAGEGAEIPCASGAKSAPGTGRPIDGIARSSSWCAMLKCASARASLLRRRVHIRVHGIDIILNTTPPELRPSLFLVMGIDPTSKKILVIKSTNHFFASFSRIASEILYCSAGTPTPTTRRGLPIGGQGATSGRWSPTRTVRNDGLSRAPSLERDSAQGHGLAGGRAQR